MLWSDHALGEGQCPGELALQGGTIPGQHLSAFVYWARTACLSRLLMPLSQNSLLAMALCEQTIGSDSSVDKQGPAAFQPSCCSSCQHQQPLGMIQRVLCIWPAEPALLTCVQTGSFWWRHNSACCFCREQRSDSVSQICRAKAAAVSGLAPPCLSLCASFHDRPCCLCALSHRLCPPAQHCDGLKVCSL